MKTRTPPKKRIKMPLVVEVCSLQTEIPTPMFFCFFGTTQWLRGYISSLTGTKKGLAPIILLLSLFSYIDFACFSAWSTMFYTLSQQKEKQKIKWNFCFSLSDEQQLDIVGCKFKVASFTSLFFSLLCPRCSPIRHPQSHPFSSAYYSRRSCTRV